jgi:hypothetical protein
MYTRYEFTEKSAEELVLTPTFNDHHVFGIHALTLGLNHDLLETKQTRLAAGAQWSIYGSPNSLNSLYGEYPMAFQVYLRVYPGLMRNTMKM